FLPIQPASPPDRHPIIAHMIRHHYHVSAASTKILRRGAKTPMLQTHVVGVVQVINTDHRVAVGQQHISSSSKNTCDMLASQCWPVCMRICSKASGCCAIFIKLGRAPTTCRIFIATNDTDLLCHESHEFALISFATNYTNLH